MKNYFTITIALLTALFYACESPVNKNINGAGADWSHYLGDPSSSQYSILDQINKDNVDQLEIAWTYVTGDSAVYQTNNLIIDGRLYTASPHSKVMALDGATGKHLWTFNPNSVNDYNRNDDQRGLMYWDDGGNGRILSMKGPYLYALDAITGELITSFGEDGAIHLGDGYDESDRNKIFLNTSGYIYKDLLIIGAVVPEDVPGAIRAFDIRTGIQKWIFHPLPRPGEYGSETYEEGYYEKTGAASNWSGIAIDMERGIVYVPTESAGPDFYAGFRDGTNLFANSLVALDANTGERLWHQQLVHHDMWDMDLPTPPNLMTVEHNGKMVDIVAQGTKMGLLFVFDRVTGEPLWPIEERPAPKSEIDGITTWPTQPFPTKPPPLMRQKYTTNDYSNISPKAFAMTVDRLNISGSYGPFPPPSLKESIIFPGFDGGMEWGGAAADNDGILYVNINEIPWFYQLIPTAESDGKPLLYGERTYRIECASCHGADLRGDPSGGFPSLYNLSKRFTQDSVMKKIEIGGGRMPGYHHLSNTRKQAIVDFLFGIESEANSRKEKDEGFMPYNFRGFKRWSDDEGYPAIKPPWGTLNAVDLNTGTIKWKVPLGEYDELTKRGIPVTGTENYGGPVVTAGRLLFIGATADGKFRVFDKETGEILKVIDLPLDGNSTPSTYMANGKQYVVISAGGSKMKSVNGGTIVAFSLPD